MKKEDIKKLITTIGFFPEEAKEDIYIKSYKQHSGYILRVDFTSESIGYGDKITIGDKTTSNFSSSENFVVLECVDKLLTKGYSPEKLTLEIKWELGHKEKGKLDIYVADKNDDKKCFLMIECKTFGNEYDKERKNMLLKGGQLFSYFQQDKSAQYLCLYASQLNDRLEYVNSIVKITEEIRTASNKNETHAVWDKVFKDNGIFEDWTNIYDIQSKALIRDKLRPLQQSDSGFIFNRFAEILRHNVVSDKANAFNKIFNLFLCKIEDENRNGDEEVSFQWKEDDTNITLQNRLNNLYKEGMRKFLNINVADFNDTDLEKELTNLTNDSRKHIAEMFIKLRLYKNNEFTFKEVFDENSFEENAKVVKEVVELLQPYQLRYSHKQQFLGDFFELLLNTGLKQESGQFFTPVPIAKFITSSIPLQEIIEKKLESREENFLPYVIDYAAGSGHFLTETMDEIQHIIEAMDKDKFKESVKKKLKSYSEDTYAWANEFIYGIEKDYRLVKTAKVACFLNGDGLANLSHADGLDSFEHSADYEKILKKTIDSDKKNNHQFDVIVANPPYSVSAFKNTLKNGKDSFTLFNRLTDDSSEIECLFIERTKQLLKEGSYAGIILPSSILSNNGIYSDTREIILKNFEIIGIAEFGSNTFMATNTSTVTLFLKKIDENHWLRVNDCIIKFIQNPSDMTCNGIEKAFSAYCNEIYQDISFIDYKAIISGIIHDKILELEIFKDYKSLFEKSSIYKNLIAQKWFKDSTEDQQKTHIESKLILFIKDREAEKLLYFMLSYNKQVVLIKSGEKQTEKDFLGYEFSNRRGHEGMRMYFDKKGKPTTKLYDMDNLLNNEKANSYIHRAFLGEQILDQDITESLKKYIYIKKLHEMFSFDKVDFCKEISLVAKKKIEIETKWELTKLGEVCNIVKGVIYAKGDQKEKETKNVILTADNVSLTGNMEITKRIFLEESIVIDQEKRLKNKDIFMCFSSGSKSHLGKVAYIHQDTSFYAGGFMGILRAFETKIKPRYLFEILNSKTFRSMIIEEGTGSNINNLSNSINHLKIPLPPLKIQEKIVHAFESLEKEKNEFKKRIENINIDFEKEIDDIDSELIKLESIAIMNPSKKEISDLDINTEVSFIEMSSVSNNGFIEHKENRVYNTLKKGSYTYFKEGDILIAKITPSMENGKCGIAKNLTNNLGMGSSEFHVIRTKNEVINNYLFLFLNRNSIRKEAEKYMTGASGHKRVPIDFYKNLKIPLPSLNKQRELVEKIEILENEKKELEINLSKLKDQESKILQSFL